MDRSGNEMKRAHPARDTSSNGISVIMCTGGGVFQMDYSGEGQRRDLACPFALQTVGPACPFALQTAYLSLSFAFSGKNSFTTSMTCLSPNESKNNKDATPTRLGASSRILSHFKSLMSRSSGSYRSRRYVTGRVVLFSKSI